MGVKNKKMLMSAAYTYTKKRSKINKTSKKCTIKQWIPDSSAADGAYMATPI